jgi:hypothetical protein
MNKPTHRPNNGRQPAAELTRQFCLWFWHHCKKAHGIPLKAGITTKLAAQGLFQLFDANPALSERDTIRAIRQDREGALSLTDATICKAGIEAKGPAAGTQPKGWDLTSLGKIESTIPSLKWDRNIFHNSGAWWFFREAIGERMWSIPEIPASEQPRSS